MNLNNELTSTVIFSNEFAREARLPLNHTEWLLFLYAVSHVEKDFRFFQPLDFTIGHFCKIFGVKNSQEVKAAILSLSEKQYFLHSISNNLFEICSLEKNKVTLKIDKSLEEHLIKQFECMTITQLGYFKKLKSKYTIRLYIFALSFHGMNFYNTTAEKFYNLLGNPYNYYSDYKRRILLPAQAEMKEKTQINLSFNLNKNYIIFFCYKKPTQQIFEMGLEDFREEQPSNTTQLYHKTFAKEIEEKIKKEEEYYKEYGEGSGSEYPDDDVPSNYNYCDEPEYSETDDPEYDDWGN